MKYGIVIFPSKSLQDLANSYRKRYDPHYALIPPHLTLISPFKATEKEARAIAEKLRKIAEKSRPFRINVPKFSSFKPVNNVIYMKVEPTKEIMKLQEELKALFPHINFEYSFIPHVTIGQKLSDVEHSDIYGALKMQKINHQEEIDRFHLLYQLENHSWTVYETFRLGKDK